MTRPPAPHRRAFTLIEVLVTLLLTGIFLIVFLPLWNTAWRVQIDAPEAAGSIFLAEAAAAQLRADVWAADGLTVEDPDTLLLETPGGSVVRWSIEPLDEDEAEVRLTRSAEADRVYALPAGPAEPAAFSLSSPGGGVTLSLAGRRLFCPAPLTEPAR